MSTTKPHLEKFKNDLLGYLNSAYKQIKPHCSDPKEWNEFQHLFWNIRGLLPSGIPIPPDHKNIRVYDEPEVTPPPKEEIKQIPTPPPTCAPEVNRHDPPTTTP